MSSMSIRRTHNGIVISDIIKGYHVERLYQGYSVRKAKQLFSLLYTQENNMTGMIKMIMDNPCTYKGVKASQFYVQRDVKAVHQFITETAPDAAIVRSVVV